MKKLFASFLFAVSAFFLQPAEAHDPRWAYVYLDSSQNLSTGAAVDWNITNGGQGLFSEGIWVDDDNTQDIVIKHPGTYLITYSTTVRLADLVNEANGDDGDVQFALYLNGTIVNGSIYGTGNAFSNDFISDVFNGALDPDDESPFVTYDAQTQVNGQVILRVRDHYSHLALKNHCENDVVLDNTVGTDSPGTWNNNVSASIVINRIDKHHDDE